MSLSNTELGDRLLLEGSFKPRKPGAPNLIDQVVANASTPGQTPVVLEPEINAAGDWSIVWNPPHPGIWKIRVTALIADEIVSAHHSEINVQESNQPS